jgi:hypothetical protein
MTRENVKRLLWLTAIPAGGLMAGGIVEHLARGVQGPTGVLVLLAGVATAGFVWVFGPFGSIGEAMANEKAKRFRNQQDMEAAQLQNDLRKCGDIIKRLEQQANRVPQAAKEHVRECIRLSSLINQAITLDTNKKKAAAVFLNDHLIPMEETVGTYLRLSERKLTLADEALRNAEEKILPGIAQSLDAFYNNIHLGDITRLATADARVGVKASAEAQAELGL